MGNKLFELKDSELEKISAGDILGNAIDVVAGTTLGLPGVGPLAVNRFIGKCLDIMFNSIERVSKTPESLANARELKRSLKNDVKIMTVTGAVSGILTCGAIGVSAAKLGYDYGCKSKEKLGV